MVALNPENPTQVQPFINWAMRTQEPRPDVSGEIRGKAVEGALQGGASAIREGAQGITAAYEKGIQNTIYAGVDPLRDEYMAQLHSTDQILQGKDTPDPLGRDAPRDVKQLPRTLETFDSARANGKLSQTDYDARLNSLAKEIRAKYPGFRQYVDEEFKRVTGRDSANQYIRSVIQDIDSFIAGRQAKRDALETKLMGEGLKFVGADQVIAAYKKNPEAYGPTALHWLNEHLAADHIMQEHRADMAAAESEEKLNTGIETKAFSQAASRSAMHSWNAALHTVVMAADLGNPKWNQDLRDWERTGVPPRDMTSDEGTAIGSYLSTNGDAFAAIRAKDLTEMVTPQTSGGPAQSTLGRAAPSRITPAQIQKQIKEEKELYWDHFQSAMVKGDLPLAMRTIELNKAHAADDLQTLMNNKDYGQVLTRLKSLRELDPNAYQQAISALQGNPAYNKYVAPALVKDITDMFTPQSQGATRPLSKIISDAQTKNIMTPDGHYAKSLVDTVTSIAKKGPASISDEAKDSVIQKVFNDPDGPSLLKYFADDTYFREGFVKQGGMFKGQQWVYDQFFSDGMIQAVAKRAKEHPEFYIGMSNMAEASSRVLNTKPEFTQAAPERTRPGTVSEMLADRGTRGIGVSYNDKSQEFTFTFNGKKVNRPDLNALSTNIHRLAVIAQHDPNRQVDPTFALFGHLDNYKAEDGSIINKMMRAIAATVPLQQEEPK